MKTLFCKSLAGGGLCKKCKKRKLQPQIFAGVWCLLLTPFQEQGRGDVSSLPLLQREVGAYVPDNLNHLLHKGEQQESYLGTWDNDGILKHLAGWHSRSNTKWSLDNFSPRSAGALLSLGSRNSSVAKAGSCQKGLLPYWSTSGPLKGEGSFTSSAPKGKRGQLLIEYIFARHKNQVPQGCVQDRRHAWAESQNSSDSSACYCLCHWFQKESQSARFCPSVNLPVSARSGTGVKHFLKLSGKRLEYVHITVDIWTWVRGQNWGLPVCHTSKGRCFGVSLCSSAEANAIRKSSDACEDFQTVLHEIPFYKSSQAVKAAQNDPGAAKCCN